jgi:hypothetical protein
VISSLCCSAIFSYPLSQPDELTPNQNKFLSAAVAVVLSMPITLPVFYLLCSFGLKKLGIAAVPLRMSSMRSDMSSIST